MTYTIGEPIPIKPGDIEESSDAFKLTRSLMQRIVEAENVALKNEIEANAVVVNGRKYGMLKRRGLPPTVFGMKLSTRADMPDDWDFFIQYRPPEPQTNADRIRGMTDEELARLFAPTGNGLKACPDGAKYPKSCEDGCGNCWLRWLKSPVEE